LNTSKGSSIVVQTLAMYGVWAQEFQSKSGIGVLLCLIPPWIALYWGEYCTLQFLGDAYNKVSMSVSRLTPILFREKLPDFLDDCFSEVNDTITSIGNTEFGRQEVMTEGSGYRFIVGHPHLANKDDYKLLWDNICLHISKTVVEQMRQASSVKISGDVVDYSSQNPKKLYGLGSTVWHESMMVLIAEVIPHTTVPVQSRNSMAYTQTTSNSEIKESECIPGRDGRCMINGGFFTLPETSEEKKEQVQKSSIRIPNASCEDYTPEQLRELGVIVGVTQTKGDSTTEFCNRINEALAKHKLK